jgi:hypothetical protein
MEIEGGKKLKLISVEAAMPGNNFLYFLYSSLSKLRPFEAQTRAQFEYFYKATYFISHD